MDLLSEKKELKKTVVVISDRDVLIVNIQVKLGMIIESWLETEDQKKQNALGMSTFHSQPLNVDYVRITKFVNTHNHEILPDNTLFAPQFRGLSEDIRFDIKHYVKCGVTDLPTIRSLLKLKFPDQFMLSQDLLNYIQKIKRELGNSGSDASTLLNELFTMQKEDPSFMIIPQIDPLTSCLNEIFWITSEQQMLYN